MKTLWVLLTVSACAQTNHRVIGADEDGNSMVSIECPRSMDNCYDRAAEVCQNGFDIVDSSERERFVQTMPASADCSTYGNQTTCSERPAQGFTTYTGRLLVTCR